MTAKAILEELRPLGSENYKRILLNHGVKEPCFGVKIEELKKIQKRIKKDYKLALDLYDTGVYDAMYLAGLIADDAPHDEEGPADAGSKSRKARWRVHRAMGRCGKSRRNGTRAGMDRLAERLRRRSGLGHAERPRRNQGRQ